MLEVLLALAGIVVPAAVLTMGLRRWFGGPSWREAGAFLALSLVSLHLAVITTAMPVALDEVMRGYPYRGIFGEVTSRNPDTNDTVKQMLPWMNAAREELFAFRAPLWNRYSFSGYPLLANSQSAPFSPFFLATLFVPLPKQIVAMAGLKLFVALLFGYLFLRREGCSGATAAFGSIAFGWSIFQNIYLYYPLGAVTSLLPALAWAVVGASREARRRDLLALALVVAAAFASGHPESVLILALGGAVLLAAEIARDRRDPATWRRAAFAVAAAATGALLSAAVWIPAIEQILISHRVDAIAAGEFGRVRYPSNALWVLFNPDGYGNPARGNWSWIFHYIMVAPTYLGLIPLALVPGALLAPRSDSRTRFHAATAIVILLISLNWTVLGPLFNELPLARWSANDRLRVLVVLFVAAAAARRLERIARDGPSWLDWAGFAAVAAGAGYVFAARFGIVLEPIHCVGIVGLAGFVATLGLAWRRTVDPLRRIRWIGGSAAAAVALELWVFNLPFNALTPREYYAPRLPIVDAIHALAPEQPYRVVGRDWVFLPNASAHYGLEDVRGSDPMAWGRYTEFFRLIHSEGNASDVGRVMNFDHPAVDFLNALFLIAEPGSEFGKTWELVYRGADGDLYRNREWIPRFFAPRRLRGVAAAGVPLGKLSELGDYRELALVEGLAEGRAIENGEVASMWIGRMEPGRYRLTLEAEGRTLIASSEPALPGWRVEVNGEKGEVVQVNGAFVGFFVPGGRSRVVVEYAPASFLWGLGGTLAAAAMVVVAGGRWRRLGKPVEREETGNKG